jgi:hypothetical protein
MAHNDPSIAIHSFSNKRPAGFKKRYPARQHHQSAVHRRAKAARYAVWRDDDEMYVITELLDCRSVASIVRETNWALAVENRVVY